LILLAVTAVSSVANVGDFAVGSELLRLFVLGGAVSVILYFVSKYILPGLISFVGGNQEVLFIFSIAWGLGLSSLFHAIGFSIEIGALVAGVMLAVSPFAYEIGARMKPLRDFFILIFFILLGAQMVLSQLSIILMPALILSAFVLVGNPLIVFILMNVLKYRTRTSFMAGLTVAQISEFSLILVALGLSLGHISEKVVSLVTLVGIITIAGSTYLILYADNIYKWLFKFLKLISIYKKTKPEKETGENTPDIIIFGYDRVGHEFVDAASKISNNFIVVDYNPKSIKNLEKENIPFRYGDAEDMEFLQEISFTFSRLVISTIPEHKISLLLVKHYRKYNKDGTIIVLAHNTIDAKELYGAGASYVVMPHYLGAEYAAKMISVNGLDSKGILEEGKKHLLRI
ncbi:cation:proton antiporter, partial [Candidatus Nomurabacteria bacterium]|nr:cation:proton antiporter [Candidatus Nomurabacteria bacterium]